MAHQNKLLGLLIAFSFIVSSCNKLSPAGFWKNYHSDFKIEDISDQGPWGGYRIIHWENNTNGGFKTSDVLTFAKENGWTLIDSSGYGKELPESWIISGKPIFPFNYDDSNDVGNQKGDKFPRWIDSDFKLYSFKTGWIILEPGTDNYTERNGFILMGNNKKKMTVYHLWGE